MKIFRLIIIILGFILLIYNSTQVDFNQPLEGDSEVAVIGIVAAACAIVLMLILNTSLAIKSKRN